MSGFGQYLKELREKRGLGVNQLGAFSGVSPSLISKIENGGRGKPKPKTIEKLSSALKVPYEELMKNAGYLPEEYKITKEQATSAVNNPKYARLPQEKKKIVDDMIDALLNE